MPVSANEALARWAIDAIWNRGDLDVADEVFAHDYVNHNGLIVDLVLGPEAVKITAALFRVAFPDLSIAIDELSTDDDTVVLRWTARRASTNNSEGRALAASQTLLTGVTRGRFAGGKLVESWTEWDRTPHFSSLAPSQ